MPAATDGLALLQITLFCHAQKHVRLQIEVEPVYEGCGEMGCEMCDVGCRILGEARPGLGRVLGGSADSAEANALWVVVSKGCLGRLLTTPLLKV